MTTILVMGKVSEELYTSLADKKPKVIEVSEPAVQNLIKALEDYGDADFADATKEGTYLHALEVFLKREFKANLLNPTFLVFSGQSFQRCLQRAHPASKAKLVEILAHMFPRHEGSYRVEDSKLVQIK